MVDVAGAVLGLLDKAVQVAYFVRALLCGRAVLRDVVEAVKQGKDGVLVSKNVLNRSFISLSRSVSNVFFATGLAGNFQYTAAPARLLVLVQRFLHASLYRPRRFASSVAASWFASRK